MKPLTILLAEDNQDHAELIMDTLKDFNIGNTVFHVTDGEQVMKCLEDANGEENRGFTRPDLILLDLKMPRMDGVATLRAIRASEANKKIPVIMVSTSTVDSEINTCFELGANSYVTKPLQFEEFSRKIRDLNLYWIITSELPN